ncbi:MAG: Gfo/Idh/MocA family oxidoreductase [Verrucomicrobia bacterium]|jgi:predicted dehydrogenase|nr:Gfo/Idh/MocA family oxidoreductase [Verrucomicrobiota bacterium]
MNVSGSPVNRRDFITGSSLATVMAMLGGVRLIAQEGQGSSIAPAYTGPKVKVAVIGLGVWGREILSVLGRLPQAEVAALCDSYPAFLKRGARQAPGAVNEADAAKVIADRDISALIVATPTHQHREIALAALRAGKHVYCEAPLAHCLEDARAIAVAARALPGQVFQAGLQYRADPQRHFLLPFIRSGAIGRWIMARTQYFKKESWRRASSTPEREKEINWRLDQALSLGLVGEIGMHHLDQVSWFMDRRPIAVSGQGSIRLWADGRTVADTVQAQLEFPEAVNAYFSASLASSFGGEAETYHGSDATILMRESSAWMFKEVDSPLLGWEVYARKEQFQKDTGIVLKLGGSKQASFSEAEVKAEAEKTALYYSIEAFLRNCSSVDMARKDFVEVFGGDDPGLLRNHLSEVKRVPTGGYEEGYRATVLAIKSAEAVAQSKRILLEDEWFELT